MTSAPSGDHGPSRPGNSETVFESSLKLWTIHVGVPPLDSQASPLTRGNASYCGFQAYLGCTPTRRGPTTALHALPANLAEPAHISQHSHLLHDHGPFVRGSCLSLQDKAPVVGGRPGQCQPVRVGEDDADRLAVLLAGVITAVIVVLNLYLPGGCGRRRTRSEVWRPPDLATARCAAYSSCGPTPVGSRSGPVVVSSAGSTWRRGRIRSSQAGTHQLARPRTCITAGTRTVRMR